MTITMKTAKEYYTDVFEGLRLVACGSFMLAVCGVKWTCSKIRDSRKQGRKEKVVDAEFEEVNAEHS